ncbi:MAG: substrate-binding domain-containing protein [Oceanipulchritudo sp.]
MKTRRCSISGILLLPLIFLWFAGCGGGDGVTPMRIAVIPKGTTHSFWKAVHAGAVAARDELREEGIFVEVLWKGPMREDDRSQQVGVVETFISQGVDGIILAPLDRKALVAPVRMARQAGIPVLVFDSALDDPEIVSFVATNNLRGGELAGDHLARKMDGKGKVLVLRYQVGSASTEDREAGFLAALEAYPGIEVLSSNQYAGATRDTAFTASQNLLNRFSGQFDAVFASNESATNGMLLAMKDLGLAGKSLFVGFDGGEQNLAALEKGEIDALVIQDPFRMGHDSVMTMVDWLRGRSVPEYVDTGVTVVTRENLSQPEVRKLLHPPLDLVD